MENASKAILIAGGVLIAIIVISVAMYIWQMGTDAFSSVEEDRITALKEEETIKFSQYIGDVYGSEVENCVRRVLHYDYENNKNITVNVDKRTSTSSTTKEYLVFDNIDDLFTDVAGDTTYLTTILTPQKRNDIYTGTVRTNSKGELESIWFTLKTVN